MKDQQHNRQTGGARAVSAAIVAATLLLAACVPSGSGRTPTAQPAPESAAPTVPPAPAGPATQIDGPGTYEVGADIQPGTWRSPQSCYWARLSGLSGEFGDIIANGGNEGGPAVVQIAESDAAFQTSCGGWTTVSG
ncbi:MAG: hypothetical protein ACRD0K_21730 [Egibacteraceae bacterium]